MKALTLTQPWATLVAIRAKLIETRSWGTHHRGRLAIHAAKGFPSECRALYDEEPFRQALRRAGITGNDALPLGCVLAIVELSDCVRMPALLDDQYADWLDWKFGAWARPELPFGNYATGRWAWKLEDAHRIDPIPVKGSLGLWNWDPPEYLFVR